MITEPKILNEYIKYLTSVFKIRRYANRVQYFYKSCWMELNADVKADIRAAMKRRFPGDHFSVSEISNAFLLSLPEAYKREENSIVSSNYKGKL